MKKNSEGHYGYQPDNQRGYQPQKCGNGYKPTSTPKPAPPIKPTPSPKTK